MAETDQEKPSFWRGINGVLTGTAALIGAVVALLTFLGFHNGTPSGSSISSAGSPSSSGPTSPSSSASSPAPDLPRAADDWPDYPGRADVGVTGAVALTWQEILIKCGALSDIAENHDGNYGPATGQKVEQIESHWGWGDADTEADRLTYNRIVAAGCH